MQGIGSFLEKFKNFTPPSRALSRAVCASVKEVVGLTVEEKEIRVSRGIAQITLGGAQKSEILLHKEEILKAARKNVGEGLRDIR